jgi:hypothetical protein
VAYELLNPHELEGLEGVTCGTASKSTSVRTHIRKSALKEKGVCHALDYLRHSCSFVALRNGQFLYIGGIHSSIALTRRCDVADQHHTREKSGLGKS